MSRVRPKDISKQEKEDLLDELWSMVTLLNTKEEIRNFFKDLLSETEAIMLARRVRVARMLLEDKDYDDIAEMMHMSPTTISSVHRWLQSGHNGYKDLLPRLEKELEKKERRLEKTEESMNRGSFEWLKRRYPMHYLLFNLIDLKDAPTTRRKRGRR